MNVTLMLQRSIGVAFRKMYDGFAPPAHLPVARAAGVLGGVGSLCARPAVVAAPIAKTCRPEVKRCQPQKPKPLRVLRYVEGGLPHASVGRMVMSGSMADVCAELDRLAAQEMTLH